MSLDIGILDDKGAPEIMIPLDINLHHALMVLAKSYGLTIFQYFENYYEDAEVNTEDLPLLLEQTHALGSKVITPEIKDFLSKLSDLSQYAILKKRSLIAVSD